MTQSIEGTWEQCDCPLCGAPRASAEERHAVQGSTYVRCQKCEIVYLSPRLVEADMMKLYADTDYWSGGSLVGYDDYDAEATAQKRTFEHRLAVLASHRAPGRLLDIGCGPGRFVEAAVDAQWDAYGLDVFDAAARAHPRLRSRLLQGTIADTDFEERFGVVTMLDFFEHLYDPRAFVKQLVDVVTPQGLLLIATPNYDALMRRVMGDRTVSLKVPEHVTYFTRKTLQAALAPYFSIKSARLTGQFGSAAFVAHRLSKALPPLRRGLRRFERSALARKAQFWIPSGSMLVVAERQ